MRRWRVVLVFGERKALWIGLEGELRSMASWLAGGEGDRFVQSGRIALAGQAQATGESLDWCARFSQGLGLLESGYELRLAMGNKDKSVK